MSEKIILSKNDIDILREKVRPYYTEKRMVHTLAVEKEAEKLGRIYIPEEIERLRAAALLHDITKKADEKKQLQYCEEFGIIVRTDDMLSPSVFHAITGAAVAERDFSDFADSEIISAVRWHTTGRAGMTVFESIIYLADYIEETRDFEDCVRLRTYFYDRSSQGDDPYAVLRDTMVYSFDMTISMLVSDGALIDCGTVSARNYFVAERKLG